MLGWCIVTLASARLKASVRFPPLREMYQRGGICKGCDNMPGAEVFCTREPHLEGAEVFGSQKRKPNTPIGADSETHRPDTINFLCPRLGKRITRSGAATLPTVIEEVSPAVQELFSPVAAGLDFRRITAI